MKKKVLIIANPVSGSRNRVRKSLPSLAKSILDHSVFDYSIQWTESRGHAGLLAVSALEDKTDIIVVAGGDGTLNEVINVIADTPLVLGILPLGSGNGLARHMQFPMQISNALRIINQMKVEEIDLGSYHDSVFCSVAGLGFDAYVAKLFDNSITRGFLSYTMYTIKAMFRYPFFDYQLTANHSTYQGQCFFITACNSSQYGYNMKIAPQASLQDGLLDVCILKKFPRWKSLYLVILVLSGKHENNKYFERILTSELTIKTKNPVNFQVDGEPFQMEKEVTLKIKPASLKMIVP